ncbi:unnamed protein product, partial [Discosporangium mesarthrocarpum]
VDFRSDTVTRPCENLRTAMASAEVGDDVYGEDPTVTKLETYTAHLLGKEMGLFVPSGTMANLIAIGVHCRRGDEIILGDKSHIFVYEAGGASGFLGVAYQTLANSPDGGMDVEAVERAVRPDDPHCTRSSLLCLENTHNKCGGRVLGKARVGEMCDVAEAHGLKVHMDGARLWNASTALAARPAELVEKVHSVSVCLSKGLGAPVGSVLVGEESFIREV